MDKFYQPNSGLRSSRSLDEAIYTYIILNMYSYDMPQVSLRLCDLLAPGGTLRATCHRHLASLGIGNQGEMLAEKWLWKIIGNL